MKKARQESKPLYKMNAKGMGQMKDKNILNKMEIERVKGISDSLRDTA